MAREVPAIDVSKRHGSRTGISRCSSSASNGLEAVLADRGFSLNGDQGASFGESVRRACRRGA